MNYNHGTDVFFNREINLELCFSQFLPLPSFKLVDLKNTFCSKIITKPIPNSTADKTRKKKVSDNKLTLSETYPMAKTTMYSVIQSNSAVNSRWSAFVTLNEILNSIKKNSIK